ncbi:MAG: CDP-diacylglycerol--serine O-phosphatidyltransferase, partial [Rhizobiales bacterium]|nr:CDP-diacylglycerol--serine O-phosphatidyltransferase [Hyphomicrobiales bacterium]
MVLPAFVSAVLFVALLIAYPWQILSVGSVVYLCSLPLGWKSYRDQQRDFISRTETAGETRTASPVERFPTGDIHSDQDNRPTHLN